jgi:monoamine oxidase
MFSSLDELTEYEGPDRSFAEYVDAKRVGEEERASLLGFVEGFNAADARRIGVCGLAAQQKAEQELEGERAWHVRGGYEQLAEYLAAKVREFGGEILPGRVVERLDWSRGTVRVQCRGGESFAAKRCVVTLPLGVLQRVNDGGVVIEPEPVQQLVAARQLAMGHAVRFVMRFRGAWWETADASVEPKKLREMSFLFTPEHVPSVWWTRYPEQGVPTLTAWVGGPRTAKLAGLSAQELGQRGCGALAHAFGVKAAWVQEQLVSVQTHDWSSDPLFLGAYSYVPAGALRAPAVLAQAVEDTLYFAGEHTDVTGNWGTVHAAVRSGLRAAAQVLGEALA